MIKLAKCCLTCSHSTFSHYNEAVCRYWTKQIGLGIAVAQPMVCDSWLDASKSEKKWDWERPERRNSYWDREIKKLNKLIWEKSNVDIR